MKQTNKSVVGTSFHSHRVNATVEQLKKILGKPVFSDNDGKDKVNFEWNMETIGGDVFTVYDWKEYRPIKQYEVINWHIGGKNPSVTDAAQTEIKNALQSLSATPSPLPETETGVSSTPGNERQESGEGFTPGPWEVTGTSKGLNGLYIDTKEKRIAQVFSSIPEGEANARLIAAAPDMLKLLVGLYNYAILQKGESLHLDNVLQDAEKLINSITGGK